MLEGEQSQQHSSTKNRDERMAKRLWRLPSWQIPISCEQKTEPVPLAFGPCHFEEFGRFAFAARESRDCLASCHKGAPPQAYRFEGNILLTANEGEGRKTISFNNTTHQFPGSRGTQMCGARHPQGGGRKSGPRVQQQHFQYGHACEWNGEQA